MLKIQRLNQNLRFSREGREDGIKSFLTRWPMKMRTGRWLIIRINWSFEVPLTRFLGQVAVGVNSADIVWKLLTRFILA